jgi:NH3-dependent NAD+ synthetase
MSRTSETSSETTWEGYSNYRDVSQRVAESVSDAVDAYSALDSRHVEGASISQEYAATARQHIFAAAIRLYTEMNSSQRIRTAIFWVAGKVKMMTTGS